MHYNPEDYDRTEEQEYEREERAGMRCVGFLLACLVLIAIGVIGADVYESKERQCVGAGGDPLHCAQEYGGP